jgi:MFS family permease
VSKVVASVYASGVVASVMFTAGTVMALISGYGSYSPADWLVVFAFSGVPLGTLLFAAARREWGQRNVSSLALAFVIAGTVLMALVGVYAHSQGLTAILSALQITTCMCGCIILKRNKTLVTSRVPGA